MTTEGGAKYEVLALADGGEKRRRFVEGGDKDPKGRKWQYKCEHGKYARGCAECGELESKNTSSPRHSPT